VEILKGIFVSYILFKIKSAMICYVDNIQTKNIIKLIDIFYFVSILSTYFDIT